MDHLRDSDDVESLMEAYVGGDRKAFARLFQLLAPQVHGFFIRRFGGDRTIADDMLQTTFLKLHRARADYRIGLPVRPWIFTIASRVRLDESSGDGGGILRPGDPEEFERASAAQAVGRSEGDPIERTETVEKVREALASLPESQRVVVQLHRYQGFTFDQIAQMLDTTEGAVKLRAFRAYERLRKQLSSWLRVHDATQTGEKTG